MSKLPKPRPRDLLWAVAVVACIYALNAAGVLSGPYENPAKPSVSVNLAPHTLEEVDLESISSAVDIEPLIRDAASDPGTLPAETVLTAEQVESYGIDALFTVQPVPDSVFARMEGVTFPADCPVARDELRYLRVLHMDAQGQVKVGEMVANAAIADELCVIFRELYEAGYPIERMRLADDYDGDDEASMRDNNTSAFNCRPIEGTGEQSRHSYGMAVDINTLYNPYVLASEGVVLPETAGEYVDRTISAPYTIHDGDLCCQLFAEHGFTWGGDWTEPKDYQHFEK